MLLTTTKRTMTDTSDFITPTKEQLREWESLIFDQEENVDVVLMQAFKAGADQELEACTTELHKNVLSGAFYVGEGSCPSWHHFALKAVDVLRAIRRPRPPSLAEQGLAQLDLLTQQARTRNFAGFQAGAIRAALTRLSKLDTQP